MADDDLTPMQERQLALIRKSGDDLIDWLTDRRAPMAVTLVSLSLVVLGMVENIDALKGDGYTDEQLTSTRRLMRGNLRDAVAKLDLALGDAAVPASDAAGGA